MASWDDVGRICGELPGVEAVSGSRGLRQWRVGRQSLAWERPLRRADYEALGDAAPDGPILGVHVPDVGAKEALIASAPDVYFTTPHFDGYPAVLVRLEVIDPSELGELVVEAWLDRAPRRLTGPFLEESGS